MRCVNCMHMCTRVVPQDSLRCVCGGGGGGAKGESLVTE